MSKIEIESAFVEAWNKNQDAHPLWGMRTAEPHSRKNESGGYDTVGRTYRTVKVSAKSGIDLTQFVKGDRVHVWGREVTETREHEGKKYYDLVVWADRIEPAESGRGQNPSEQPQAPVSQADDAWATPEGAYPTETPF